ncbi:hypothetical protein EW145_g6875 [Phellinidium pouzarii]|uniref:Signal peptidase complex subunit 1 n=1 Tax=Phellinidium pouzarii TaxID=167371 RepID=A0A4S4KSK8_9AGAM|nr:hypothetical protein EW145_g6875 [Phellinidium pouzarii]
MATVLQDIVEGKIDFEGQVLAETLTRNVLIGSTTASFILGFIAQSLRVTFSVLGACVALLYLFVVPPWPFYRKHPVKWLPAQKVAKTG